MSRNLERRQAFELTKQGRTWEVVNLLASGISPDIISEETFFDHSLLQEAAFSEHADTVAAIIACGANKEYKDKGQRTAFSYSASKGLWNVSLMLLGAGVQEDARNSEGHKPENLARAQGHEQLAEFIHEISLARFLHRNRKRATLFPQLNLQRVPGRRGITPPADAEPGYLGVTLNRRADLQKRLNQVIADERIRPLVESVMMTGIARFRRQAGSVGKDNVDLMGYLDQVFNGPALNGIRLTKKGWDAARPLVQSTLDALEIEFDAERSGLVCARGEFKLERVAVEISGLEWREFEMTHEKTGARSRCRQHFSGRWESLDERVFQERRLIQRRELVSRENLAPCPNCGSMLRSAESRAPAPVVPLGSGTQAAFNAACSGDKFALLDALCQDGSPDDRVINRNTLAHLASWCADGQAWCGHMETLATALACGTDPHATNMSGETALHSSAFFGRYFPVLLLLAADVNPEATDDCGFKASEMARLNGHENIAQMIEMVSSARKFYDRCKVLAESMPEQETSEADIKRQA